MSDIKPQDVLYQAERFRYTAISLGPDERSTDPKIDEHVIIPMMMSYAFCLEIYLKFLLLKQGYTKLPKDHDHNKLFKKLDKSTKDKIKHIWNNPKPGILLGRQHIERVTGKPHPDFDKTLKLGALAFHKFRYSYEHRDEEMSNIWLSGDIIEATRKVIFELYPEYNDIRLPLPSNAISQNEINSTVAFEWKDGE